MKKSEAERIVRYAAHKWVEETEQDLSSAGEPSFYEFREWLLERWSNALDFRSTMGPNNDAESWFDDELGQAWRN
ncbi:hypothetical protein [Maritimibacter dapengensis]|uniref:Uncharacterized protein n=1 Tax=Maritimibacter dapengensis TaxID=2836868 RepID=A0ABS6T2A6_9RHOB|nr:hypothetical protein [Maritimibacter dapengensis]MBV7379373.1 hypothetical protein [Maritimibacter dapengensis]